MLRASFIIFHVFKILNEGAKIVTTINDFESLILSKQCNVQLMSLHTSQVKDSRQFSRQTRLNLKYHSLIFFNNQGYELP